MAKSKNVTIKGPFYPCTNVMMIERYYEYEKGFDAGRKATRIPKTMTKGWAEEFSAPDDVETANGHMWIVRTFFSKRGMRKKSLLAARAKPKRHFLKKDA